MLAMIMFLLQRILQSIRGSCWAVSSGLHSRCSAFAGRPRQHDGRPKTTLRNAGRQVRESLGLNQPLAIQYGRFGRPMRRMAKLGMSYRRRQTGR